MVWFDFTKSSSRYCFFSTWTRSRGIETVSCIIESKGWTKSIIIIKSIIFIWLSFFFLKYRFGNILFTFTKKMLYLLIQPGKKRVVKEKEDDYIMWFVWWLIIMEGKQRIIHYHSFYGLFDLSLLAYNSSKCK